MRTLRKWIETSTFRSLLFLLGVGYSHAASAMLEASAPIPDPGMMVWAGASGFYDPLYIGVSDRVLTGYFDSKKPNSQCNFFLYGRFKASAYYDIVAWSPGSHTRIKGTASFFDGEEKRFYMKLSQVPAGCRNVYPLDVKEGNNFYTRIKGNWQAVRVVSAETADVYDAPDPGTRRDAHVRRLDVLRVISAKPGWVQAAFGAENQRGWMKVEDLFSQHPPNPPGTPRQATGDVLPTMITPYRHMDVTRFNGGIITAFKNGEGWVDNVLLVTQKFLDGPGIEARKQSVAIEYDSAETPHEARVLVTYDGYPDDSVRGSQYKLHLKRSGPGPGPWTLITAEQASICWRGVSDMRCS